MERDEESGLACHGARYYLATAARWLSTDPAGISQTLNVYAYCDNNPVTRVDTDGRQFLDSEKASSRYAGSLLQTPTPQPGPVVDSPAPAAGSGQPVPPPTPYEEGWFEAVLSGRSEPSFGKSLIPIFGSWQNANYNFNQGTWGWGIFYTILAATDVLLVRSLLTAGGKIALAGIRAGVSALTNISLKAAGEGIVSAFKVLVRELHPFRGRGGGLRIQERLTRFFWQTRASYDAHSSVVYRLLRQSVGWFDAQAHHWLVQAKWFDEEAKVINALHGFILKNEWLRLPLQRIGNAGWNLLPSAGLFNNYLGKSMGATFAFGVRVARVAEANIENTLDKLWTLGGLLKDEATTRWADPEPAAAR
jgi:RHS repeat-associated protein